MNEELQKKAAEAEERARQYFREGLNCSECVLKSFMDVNDVNLPPEVITLASGFGGGIGQTKNTCGAVTGAVMAISAVKGRRDPFALPEMKDRVKELQNVYQPVKALINHVEGEFGTIICRELNKPYLEEFAGKARKKNCQQMIGHCAALAVQYAEWQPEEKKEEE